MPSSPLALTFRMFHDGQLVREHTLTQSVVKIGTVPSAHLQIADDAVSRMHAIIEVTGGEVSLIDLGSTRGSFVNGERVHKARLESGDVITLGETRIEVAIAAAPARPPALPAAPRSAPAVISGTIDIGGRVAMPAAAATASASLATSAAAPPPPAGAVATPVASRRPYGAAGQAVAPPPRAAGSRSPGADARPTSSPGAAAVFAHAAVDAPAEPTAEPGGHPDALAVEVAAMLGDSVVGVKHCLDPRSGRVSRVTWALLAAGAACLVASAIAFVASVATAADNRARLEVWTRVEHRPARAFRPHRLGPAADWVAFGGSALALVGLGLGFARVRRERVSPYYRIGTAPGVECALDGAPAPAFPLVAPSGDGFAFQFAPGIDGELIVDGTAMPLAALAAAGRAQPSASTPGATEVPILRGARIRASVGGATFVVAAVARPRRHAAPLLAGLERRTASYVVGSLAAHLAVWALLQLVPPDATAANIEIGSLEPVTGRVVGTSKIDPPPPPPPDEPGERSGGESSRPAMALPPGAAGSPTATERGRLQIEDTGAPPATSREEAIASARRAGLLGDELVASAIRTLAEQPDLASGWDLESFNGPLVGGYGEGPGQFGGGVIGFGGGGGCGAAPCGLIPGSGGHGDGRSPFTTIGRGPAAGDRWGLPGRGPGSRGHQPLVPRLLPLQVSGGGYDKALIRRYIRRSIDKIGYCYDKQLLARPDLRGEVTVTFFIAPTGAVQSATGTGFDREVAACVAGVVQAIAFPVPSDGIGVQVNYPFQFHSAG